MSRWERQEDQIKKHFWKRRTEDKGLKTRLNTVVTGDTGEQKVKIDREGKGKIQVVGLGVRVCGQASKGISAGTSMKTQLMSGNRMRGE